MRILAFKPGHDGALASVADGRLELAIEEEKDSGHRSSAVSLPVFFQVLERLPGLPDAFAVSHRRRAAEAVTTTQELGPARRTMRHAFGRPLEWFHSTHEKAHLFGAYAMSPFAQGTPCYALLWDRHVGRFYRIDEKMGFARHPQVLAAPSRRFAYLHHLAEATPGAIGGREAEGGQAASVRALARAGRPGPATPDERALIDRLLDARIETKEQVDALLAADKNRLLPGSPLVRCGVDSPAFKDLARKFSDELFQRFHEFAARHLTEKLPLLIAGGGGLHGGWNTRWRESGLFADVFVPPCANDSGNPIGAAAEAQFLLTGSAKIAWSAYAGEEFVDDWPAPSGWVSAPLDLAHVAALLAQGRVVAWVQGRGEIGPRSLGHRALLGAPFEPATATALNRAADRTADRAPAALCLAEEAARHFAGPLDSPYGLYVQRVNHGRLAGVTRVDGTARVQTVTPAENPRLHALLTAFKTATGTGALGHASLHFPGRGLINRMTHLLRFAALRGVSAAVVGDRLLVRLAPPDARPGTAS